MRVTSMSSGDWLDMVLDEMDAKDALCLIPLFDQDDGEESSCQLAKGHTGDHDSLQYPSSEEPDPARMQWL